MRVPARRVPFVGSLGEGPAPAQAVGDPLRISVPGHARRHSLGAFEDALCARHPFAGKAGREETVRRCLGGVQLLGVGRVAQELPESRGLRPRRPQRLLGPVGVEAEELRGGGGGRQGSGRAGGVEHRVVRSAEEFAHADPGLVARDGGEEQLLARLLLRLG